MADADAKLPKNFKEDFLKLFDKHEEGLWKEMPEARFNYWSKRELWTLKDFAYLMKSKEPLEKNTDKVNYIPPSFVTYFDDLAHDVMDATILDKLNPILPHQDASFVYCLLSPRDWLKWAKSRGMAIPDELAPIVADESKPDMKIQDDVDPRERTTLLQIIAVLAAEAGLNLEKHSKAAETLLAIGAKHNKNLPKKKDTIANKLKEARDLQETR